MNDKNVQKCSNLEICWWNNRKWLQCHQFKIVNLNRLERFNISQKEQHGLVLLVVCVVFFVFLFFCLRSVSFSKCCLCFWIAHIRLYFYCFRKNCRFLINMNMKSMRNNSTDVNKMNNHIKFCHSIVRYLNNKSVSLFTTIWDYH